MKDFFSKIIGNNKKEEEYLKRDEEEFEQEMDYSIEGLESGMTEGISLDIDLYEDDDNLYIKTFISGINPKEIDIDISRDTAIISGEKHDFSVEIHNNNFFQRELIWGKFKKKIILPKEIDIDLVDTEIKHGVLILKLPKLDKDKKRKIRI